MILNFSVTDGTKISRKGRLNLVQLEAQRQEVRRRVAHENSKVSKIYKLYLYLFGQSFINLLILIYSHIKSAII